MKRDVSLPFVVIAATTAVAFWSLKPIFITLIGDRASYGEVFVAAGSIAVATSLIAALIFGRSTVKLVRAPGAWRGAVQAALSGAGLAMWYFGFYRALYGASKTDATIIAFSWPLIAVLAMRVFAPSHGRSLTLSEYSMVFVAFLGAIAIGVADFPSAGIFSGNGEILFAFVAALGAGLYLPFAINGIARFGQILGSKILGTFYVISLANIVSLGLVLVAFYAAEQPLRFYAFDREVWIICILIGVGTYLAAEVTWTWAFSEYESLALSSLPYFSPAVSVVLLFLFFDEPVTAIAALGLVLILFSNMTLHGRYKTNSAPVMALVGTVYIALASQVIRPIAAQGAIVDMLYAISGLFAILAGFILSRVSSRRAQEIDARAAFLRALLAARDGTPDTDERLDRALRLLIDLEFTGDLAGKEAVADRLRAHLHDAPPQAHETAQTALGAFDAWFTIHRDRLSLGEKAALWITGLGSILFLMLLRDETAFGLIGLYMFGAGCLLVIFTISDYEQHNLHGFRNQLMRLQQGFAELGRDFYLPRSVVESREYTGFPPAARVRFRDEQGVMTATVLAGSSPSFPKIYWATAAFVVGALIYLPMANKPNQSTGLSQALRPGVVSEQITSAFLGEEPDVTVAVLSWDASRVAAAILEQAIADTFELRVARQELDVTEVFAQMEEGKVQIYPDFWAENQPANLARYVEPRNGVALLNDTPYLGVQGIYTLAGDARAANLSQLADLARPEIAAFYDTDGDGLGEIWLGAPGWESTALMRAFLSEAGLETLWEGEVFADRIFKAKLARFAADGRPMIFYGYEPDSIHDTFDLLELTGLPQAGLADAACPQDLPPSLCALSSTHIHLAFARALDAERPQLALFLSRVAFTREDVSAWLARMARQSVAPERVAAEWLEDNRARVRAWAQGQQ